MRLAAICLAAICLLSATVPLRAAAQDDALNGALALYEEARFAEAITALSDILAHHDLSSAAVETALDRIAVAAFALGRTADLDDALVRLAAVAPGHAFGLDVPPPVVDRFREIAAAAAPVTIEIVTEPVPGEADRLRYGVQLEGPRDVVRAIVLRCGAGGAGHVTRSARPELVDAADVGCEADAEGPGGLPLAHAVRAPTDAPDGGPESGSSTSSDGGVDPLVLGLAIGGGVLAVGIGVGIAVAVATAGSQPGEVVIQVGITW